jgi:thiol-disulfide isomerase/thioredoxin
MRLLSVLNNLGLLPEYFWRRIPIEFDFVVQTPDKKSFNYSSVAYDNIGRALFWKGWNGFEPETTSVYYELAQESKVIFDIGANTGLFALLACVANEEGKLESIDLIKIDVEGFEDKVLAGMEQVLSAHHPIIIVECNPDGPYKIVEDIVKKHGYSIFHLSNRGVEPVDKIIPDLDEEFRNFLCLVK